MIKQYSVLIEVLVMAENTDQAREFALNDPLYTKQLYAGDGSVICMDDLIPNEVSHES